MAEQEQLRARVWALLDELRERGFGVGVESYLDIEQVLPPQVEPERLRMLLRPLVAKTREQWQEFDECFDAQFGAALAPPREREAGPARMLTPPTHALASRARWVLGVLLVVLTVAIGLCRMWEPSEGTQPDQGQPSQLVQGELPPPKRGKSPKAEAFAPKLVYGPTPAELEQMLAYSPTPSPPVWPWALGLGVATLGVALLILWRSRRRSGLRGPFTFELRFPARVGQVRPLLSKPAYLRAHIGLTRRIKEPLHEHIDIERSIARTLQRGAPMLGWRHARRPPALAVLLERGYAVHAHARAFGHLFAQLGDAGVRCDVFDYQQRPDRWNVEGPRRGSASLRERGYDRLVILGDPNVTLAGDRAMLGWLQQLRSFQAVWWFVPPNIPLSHAASELLGDMGVQLVPAELELVSRMTDEGFRPTWPRPAPGPQVSLARLREYLGPAFELLATAALLQRPSVHGIEWIGEQCFPELTSDDVLRVLGLPWVVDGEWPAGLREDLRATLGRDDPRVLQVHARLRELLARQAPPPDSRAAAQCRAHELEIDAMVGIDVSAAVEQFRQRSRAHARWLDESLIGRSGVVRTRGGPALRMRTIAALARGLFGLIGDVLGSGRALVWVDRNRAPLLGALAVVSLILASAVGRGSPAILAEAFTMHGIRDALILGASLGLAVGSVIVGDVWIKRCMNRPSSPSQPWPQVELPIRWFVLMFVAVNVVSLNAESGGQIFSTFVGFVAVCVGALVVARLTWSFGAAVKISETLLLLGTYVLAGLLLAPGRTVPVPAATHVLLATALLTSLFSTTSGLLMHRRLVHLGLVALLVAGGVALWRVDDGEPSTSEPQIELDDASEPMIVVAAWAPDGSESVWTEEVLTKFSVEWMTAPVWLDVEGGAAHGAARWFGAYEELQELQGLDEIAVRRNLLILGFGRSQRMMGSGALWGLTHPDFISLAARQLGVRGPWDALRNSWSKSAQTEVDRPWLIGHGLATNDPGRAYDLAQLILSQPKQNPLRSSLARLEREQPRGRRIALISIELLEPGRLASWSSFDEPAVERTAERLAVLGTELRVFRFVAIAKRDWWTLTDERVQEIRAQLDSQHNAATWGQLHAWLVVKPLSGDPTKASEVPPESPSEIDTPIAPDPAKGLCGDNQCSGNEACDSCPQDCGDCVCVNNEVGQQACDPGTYCPPGTQERVCINNNWGLRGRCESKLGLKYHGDGAIHCGAVICLQVTASGSDSNLTATISKTDKGAFVNDINLTIFQPASNISVQYGCLPTSGRTSYNVPLSPSTFDISLGGTMWVNAQAFIPCINGANYISANAAVSQCSSN